MEEDSLQGVLKSLEKSTDKSKSYKCLLCIRRHVDRKANVKKLREHGGLKIIVQFLSRKNINILDVTLSILGNCCLEFESAKEVVSHNIVKALGDILRSCKQDSIYGRVCRIVGNISQFTALSKYFNTNQSRIITAIVAILVSSKNEENEISEATQLMAIRALRTVFHRPYGPYSVNLMEAENVVRTVASIIVHYADKWVEKQEYHVLLKACIRCLSDLSSSLTSYESLEQLIAGGEGIKCMVKILPISPYSIVKIITQLSPYAKTRSELEIPVLCNNITKQIKNEPNYENGNWPREYVNALCLLCVKHQINCDEVRLAGGLSVLHEIFRNDPSKRFESVILKALKAYIYDEAACTHLATSGFVDTLINKLATNHNANEYSVNDVHEYLKRGCCRKNRRIHLTYKRRKGIYDTTLVQNNYLQFLQVQSCSSPTRSLSETSSPRSSPSASPSHSNDLELTDDSENYSPVCSDNEIDEGAEDSENTSSNSTTFSLEYEEPLSDQEIVNCNCIDEDMADMMGPRNFLAILSILTAFSRIKPPVIELGKPHTLLTLLKYVLNARYPRTAILKFLYTLLGTSSYLLPLMQTEFIQTLYELTEMQHNLDCAVCYQKRRIGLHLLQRLTKLTECGGIRGDIAHCLLRGDYNTKTKLLLAVPYIVKNKHTLQKIMLNCDGLTILMKLMEDSSDVQRQSIKVLCVLASQSLGIISPFCPTSSEVLSIPEYKLSKTSTTVVTFLLDDDSQIQADRKFLSEKSDFFSTLLTGQFKESKEEVIQLKNVPNKPFKLLLSLMSLELPHLVIRNINVDVETLLGAISLADRYMLVDLCVYLTRTVEQYKITTKNVPCIYRWSLESGTNLLRIESIAHALVGNAADSERFDMFTALFDLGCSEHLIGDIRTLLVRYLNVHNL